MCYVVLITYKKMFVFQSIGLGRHIHQKLQIRIQILHIF